MWMLSPQRWMAGLGRAGADLRFMAGRPRGCSSLTALIQRLHAVEPADHGVDAVFGSGHPRPTSSSPRAWNGGPPRFGEFKAT